MIEFAKFTDEEQVAVDSIVFRALPLFRKMGVRWTEMDIRMDLAATHARCPLRLVEFAEADDFNFAHDVTGIFRHMDRETGELGDCFVPRYARPAGTVVG